ncbi:hypothetical protein MiSe_27830 [Microseira wollei NIES-4236]|uniref:Uncharacterized protein n=1 Tax=Microseira wollei NIES-4236 TaxID=2530354 RepID=A0AAV3X796_9CYAN|nr:hypothetical protein MiSe_27830 [Microseira wollei NIES-4236]
MAIGGGIESEANALSNVRDMPTDSQLFGR